MIKQLVILFLACYILLGSLIFPLGDFALTSDLPEMYHSYCEITAENPDPIDFIGDYIWSGKDLFGHNKKDAPTNSSLQFQHHAMASLYCSAINFISYSKIRIYLAKPLIRKFNIEVSDYQTETLRPPIV